MHKRPFVIVGGGGFGKDVMWAVQAMNAAQMCYEIVGYCDDDPQKQGRQILDYTVLGSPEDVAARFVEPCFVCSIGDNAARARVVQRVLALGWTPVTVIDPSVMIAEGVVIGNGSYIGARAILSPKARIGDHVLINNHTTIGHDCTLGDFAQVSPGARVSGFSVLKEGALLGANAVVAPGKTIGRYATLGACSFAMTNVPDESTAIGIPARVAFRRNAIGEKP